MARLKKLDKKVLDLVCDGNYDIVQIINGGDEEPYEGCVHNLCNALISGEANVCLLNDNDPHARAGHTTYSFGYSTFHGNITFIIWEI